MNIGPKRGALKRKGIIYEKMRDIKSPVPNFPVWAKMGFVKGSLDRPYVYW